MALVRQKPSITGCVQTVAINSKCKLWLSLMRFGHDVWGCHQIADRSFFIGDYQFPVCARCTGLMIGELIYLIVYRKSKKCTLSCGTLLCVPLVIDGSVQAISSYHSTNAKRFVTGVFCGYGWFAIIKRLANWILK